MGWRITYAVLCVLALVAYFMPWATMGDTSYSGWSGIVPFTFTYFIGLIIALVVLFTRYKAVGLTIFAGILMFIGVLGGIAIAGVAGGLSEAAGGGAAHTGGGMVFAFLISVAYTILGAIAGNKFKKATMVIETK